MTKQLPLYSLRIQDSAPEAQNEKHRQHVQVFWFKSVDVLEGDSSIFWPPACENTTDSVFTSGTSQESGRVAAKDLSHPP